MAFQVLTITAASVTALKPDPMGTVNAGEGAAVARITPGRKDQFKIKLRGAGYRLVYSANDDIVTVTVIGPGKRENDDIYNATQRRN